MEEITKLSKKEIEKLSFKELINLLESINEYFQNNEDEKDIENALELYKKALDILSSAQNKMTFLKEEKEKIDYKYEEFKKSLES